MQQTPMILNFSIIFLSITIFFSCMLLTIRKTRSISCYESIYERSGLLLILANISNYIETILNLIYGYFQESKKEENISFLYSYFALATFFTRIYAACMGLRVLRIGILHHARKEGLDLRSQLLFSWKIVLLFTFAYGIITTGFYFLVYFSYNTEFARTTFIQILYGLEGFLMFFGSYLVFDKARHPSISIEYIFYSIIWITGCTNNDFKRYLFIIPIRNMTLLFISFASLMTHNKLIRPQLPFMVEFHNLFEIQELYESFCGFVEKYGSIKEKAALGIFFRIKVQQLCPNSKNKTCLGAIIDDFIHNQELMSARNSLALLNLDLIEDSCREILSKISHDYLQSFELIKLKRAYFIDYN